MVDWATGLISFGPKKRDSTLIKKNKTEILPLAQPESEQSSESESSLSGSSSSSESNGEETCIVEPSMETLRSCPKTMTPNPKGVVFLGPGLYGTIAIAICSSG